MLLKLPGRHQPFSQNLVSGFVLICLAALGLWLTSDLSQGTLSAMGAGLLPRWLALSIGLCGIILLVIGFRHRSEAVGVTNWHGITLIMTAIIGFGLFIRPFAIGSINTPSLGFIIAGPFAVVVGGLAAPDARLRELVLLALVLTASCMLLFSDLLNLPIPIFPQFVTPYFAGMPAKLVLRMAAAIMLLIDVVIAIPDLLELRRSAKLRTAPLEKNDD